MPQFTETREYYRFPDLPGGVSAKLVRVQGEPTTYRTERTRKNSRGLEVSRGEYETHEYTLDTNALVMSRIVVGRESTRPHETFIPIREGSQVGQAVDSIHLPEIPQDQAARLALVREHLQAFLA